MSSSFIFIPKRPRKVISFGRTSFRFVCQLCGLSHEYEIKALSCCSERKFVVQDKLTIDNEDQIFFYEQEFYVFSNFSSFQIVHKGKIFQTSEHLYHWNRFVLSDHPGASEIAERIYRARSAHDAFKLAQQYKSMQVENWDEIKQDVMYSILKLKVDQHEYVKKKLIESEGRILIENYNDNSLGELWMRLREELIAKN